MDVALPALAGGQVIFEIGINVRGVTDVVERCGSERRASQIRMQDHPGSVNHWRQGIAQRLAELTFHGCGQAAEGDVQRFLVQLGVIDFLAKAREHDTDAFDDGGMPLAFDQQLHV